jgi:hypothetical protein
VNVAFRPAGPEDLERLTALKLEMTNPRLARIGRLARSAPVSLMSSGRARPA